MKTPKKWYSVKCEFACEKTYIIEAVDELKARDAAEDKMSLEGADGLMQSEILTTVEAHASTEQAVYDYLNGGTEEAVYENTTRTPDYVAFIDAAAAKDRERVIADLVSGVGLEMGTGPGAREIYELILATSAKDWARIIGAAGRGVDYGWSEMP